MKGIGGLFILLFLLAIVGTVIYFIGDNAKVTGNTVAVTLVNGTYINYSSFNDTIGNITIQNINDTLNTKIDSNNVTLTDLIATSILGTSDNTTQNNLITANNVTQKNQIDSLDGTVTGLNTRQGADNTTVSNRFASYLLTTSWLSENTTIQNTYATITNLNNQIARQGADNTTLSDLITSLQTDNTTQGNLISSLETNVNSNNVTLKEYIDTKANQTDLFNNASLLTALITKQGADNTTQANLITGNNNTITNNLTGVNARINGLTALQNSDNTTIKNTGAFLGLNNVFTGTNYFNILNVSGNGFLDGDVRTSQTWESGGWLISGGNIYAQTLFLLKGINTTTIQQQNMNGSLIPILNNEFVLGNSSHTWSSVSSNIFNGSSFWVGTTNILTKIDSNNVTLSDRFNSLSTVTTLPATNISTGKFGGGSGLYEFSNLSIFGNFSVRSSSTGSEIFRIIDDPDYGYYAGLISNPDFNYGLTVTTINAPSGVYDNGIRLITRINSNNITLKNYIDSVSGTSDNTTQNNLITANNVTLKNYVDSVAGGTSDNTTQKDAINTKANQSEFKSTTDTINANLGTKLNLTGGVINGYLNVTNGNLSLGGNYLCINVNCSRRIYSNATHIILENLG